MKKNTERGLTPLRGDQGARSARKPSIGVNENPYSGSGSQESSTGSDGYNNAGQGSNGYYNDYSTSQNSNGYYNAQQGYSEPITETDYFQTFEGEEDPLAGMAADYVAGRNYRSSAEVNDATMLYSGKVSPEDAKVGNAVKTKTPLSKKQIAMLAGIIVLGVVAIVCGIMLFVPVGGSNAAVREDVVLEAGSAITLDAFFDNVPMDAVFLTDVSGIDITQPAVYQLKIGYGRNKVADVILRIEDHTGPTGEPIPQELYLNWKMPEPKECIADLFDLSGIAKVVYTEGTPKFTNGGMFQVSISATDVYGNTTLFQVPFNMIDDHTPPVIKGVHDLTLEGNPDQLNFFAGVTVTDDYDPEPVIKVDESLVNYGKGGTYDLVYKAIDKAGNISTAKCKLTINMPVEEEEETTSNTSSETGTYYVGDGDPYALADSIVSGLRRGSDVETARAIFNWVHDTLWFRLLSGTPDYEDAAYRGFTRHSGDCFVYYSCCKMLLDAAGIPNMRIERYPQYNGNIHYWLLVKLNGEWYHCDATEGYNDHPGVWFMCTDDEINDKYHQFNGSLYPARAGGSSEFLATPTPSPSPSPTPSASPSPSVTPTGAESPSPSVSPTPTGTETPSPSVSPTPSESETEPQPSPTESETEPQPTPSESETEPQPTPSESETEPQPTPSEPSEDTPAPTPVEGG